MNIEEAVSSVSERLARDLEAIYIGNLATVDADLKFPPSGRYGSSFRWESSDERFISSEGRVHRALHGMGNRRVLLTVTATLEGESMSRSLEADVLEEGVEMVITSVDPVELTARKGSLPPLPPYVIVRCQDGRQTVKRAEWEVPGTKSKQGKQRPENQAGKNQSLENQAGKNQSLEDQAEEKQSLKDQAGEGQSPEELAEKKGQETIVVRGRVEGTDIPAVARIHLVSQIDTEKEKGPDRLGEFIDGRRVRLLPGSIFYEKQELSLEYLAGISDDTMLYSFRKASGLDTRGAVPMTGWDAEDSLIKGHTTGHYLSGLALAYAVSGRERFKDKIDYMADSLLECQKAFERLGTCQKGFLSAYSEEQFDLLEVYTKYPIIWAPYYTLDKIISGLIDCYQLADCEQALTILKPLGEWVYRRLARLPEEQREKMWSMYIAGEFGGMIASMARLGEITGDKHCYEAARFFNNEKLFYPMAQNVDTLEDMHANQHIPQIIGMMELYRLEGQKRDWEIGKNFWDIVRSGHTYVLGGVGETEMFHRAGSQTKLLTDKAAESCASYNLCRLTGQIFAYTEDASMMDYYENTLRNHLMASASHAADGGTTYFMPLGAGMRKLWSTTENTCCHATGMESRFRYQGNIYFQDRDFLRICLLVDSRLEGENGLELTVRGEEVTITIREDMDRRLKVRIPSWAGGFSCRLGEAQIPAETEDGWLTIPGKLKAGDQVTLHLPMKVTVTGDPFDPTYANISYGPWLLAALSESREFLAAPEAESITACGEENFKAGSIKMIPLARVDGEAYHTYFKR